MNDQHGYHMKLLAQNYGFSTISQPQFAYSATHGIHQSFGVGLNEHGYRSFNECSSSQRHIESSHNQYEIREDEATFDLCNDAHAQKSNENSEDDESSEDDGESKAIESKSDEDIGDLPQKDSGPTNIPSPIIFPQKNNNNTIPMQRTTIQTAAATQTPELVFFFSRNFSDPENSGPVQHENIFKSVNSMSCHKLSEQNGVDADEFEDYNEKITIEFFYGFFKPYFLKKNQTLNKENYLEIVMAVNLLLPVILAARIGNGTIFAALDEIEVRGRGEISK
uniref:Uncharacterized protein n=1 Tax=Solanum tuberosum TaxID=4113 RepID=M1DUP8_SOLTU